MFQWTPCGATFRNLQKGCLWKSLHCVQHSPCIRYHCCSKIVRDPIDGSRCCAAVHAGASDWWSDTSCCAASAIQDGSFLAARLTVENGTLGHCAANSTWRAFLAKKLVRQRKEIKSKLLRTYTCNRLVNNYDRRWWQAFWSQYVVIHVQTSFFLVT